MNVNKLFYTIEITDKPAWEKTIKQCIFYDIYHTYFYHSLESSFPSVLFVSEFNDELIVFPFKVRNIEDTGYFDLTSVYGYCGPISNKKFNDLSKEHFAFFHDEFAKFCNENYVVSIFSRLHPLVDYSSFFEDLGEVADINKTVVIDVAQPRENQVKEYRKSTRHEIRYLREKNYSIIETKDPKDIDNFIEMYYKTMEKVRAFERYYYNRDYFHGFLNNDDYEVMLLMAEKDGEYAAGGIFTVVGNVMQYHLATTAEKYISDAPMKLILDEARKRAIDRNLEFLHLGGGFAGRDNDNLYLFKCGFSKNRLQFSVWKHITDTEQYDKLVAYVDIWRKVNNFFPLYRN
ncbi:GNAT family N-acetyltransferase [Chryseobacterium sp. MMS23-Vi53]|uniref:GNAT family N-acetyltransferase n=1 Tax=Chryseobacterium sp. MMS23-Vi53 TaxID=3386644 RepID=UPI0039EC5E55